MIWDLGGEGGYVRIKGAEHIERTQQTTRLLLFNVVNEWSFAGSHTVGVFWDCKLNHNFRFKKPNSSCKKMKSALSMDLFVSGHGTLPTARLSHGDGKGSQYGTRSAGMWSYTELYYPVIGCKEILSFYVQNVSDANVFLIVVVVAFASLEP